MSWPKVIAIHTRSLEDSFTYTTCYCLCHHCYLDLMVKQTWLFGLKVASWVLVIFHPKTKKDPSTVKHLTVVKYKPMCITLLNILCHLSIRNPLNYSFLTSLYNLQEADIAAAPVFITAQREKAVDFTRPFLRVTPTVLIRKAHHADISTLEVKQLTSCNRFSRPTTISRTES